MAGLTPKTPLLRLLLILGSTWLVLALYSFSSVRLSLLGRPLAKAPVAALLGVRPPAARLALASLAMRVSFPLHNEPPSLNEVAPNSPAVPRSAERILLFGDSMVPVLAPRLADYCLENGHSLLPAVWYGSTIMHWAWENKLDLLLVEFRPTIAIAVLGSSELTVREVEECEPYIHNIARKVGPRKFAWIGPPNWRKDTGVNALILNALGKRRFFFSGGLTLDREGDSIHPSKHGGTQWTDAFVQWLVSESDSAIALTPPTRVAPPVPARVYAPSILSRDPQRRSYEPTP